MRWPCTCWASFCPPASRNVAAATRSTSGARRHDSLPNPGSVIAGSFFRAFLVRDMLFRVMFFGVMFFRLVRSGGQTQRALGPVLSERVGAALPGHVPGPVETTGAKRPDMIHDITGTGARPARSRTGMRGDEGRPRPSRAMRPRLRGRQRDEGRDHGDRRQNPAGESCGSHLTRSLARRNERRVYDADGRSGRRSRDPALRRPPAIKSVRRKDPKACGSRGRAARRQVNSKSRGSRDAS